MPAVGIRCAIPAVRAAMWLLHVSLPMLGLALLLSRPELDLHYEHHGTHFWVVLVTGTVSLALAVVMVKAVRRRQDARLFLISLVFSLNAGFLALHALATPGMLLDSGNAGFVAASPAGLVVGGVVALASSTQLGPRTAEVLMRWQWLVAAMPWVLLGGWAVLSFARLPPLDLPPEVVEAHPLMAAAALAGTCCYLAAAARYLVLHRERRGLLLLSVLTAFVLLGEATVAVALSRSWRVSWWEWHLLMVAAFALIAVSAHVRFRREGSALGLFDSMTLRQTLESLQRDYASALEEMVESLRRRATGQRDAARADVGVAVARRFGLTEAQVAVLHESAEALGRERQQVQRLNALAAIGERSSIIRSEDQLIGEVLHLASAAFPDAAFRLALTRSAVLTFLDGAPATSPAVAAAAAARRPVSAPDAATFAVPLSVTGKLAGVLEIRRGGGAAFTEADRAVLVSLASTMSVALENTRIYQQISGLFRSYISPAVATALLADPDQAGLGGRVQEVSVLMADLRGFTAFAEQTSPDKVVAMLNTYYGAVVPIILDAGGTVVQFVGDAVMAIFNAPVRQLDHARRAARAALGLHRAVAAVGDGRPHWPRFRVGINTGPALVGNIGAQQMRNFTAIGDTTNLAARLEALAQPGSVVIGATTRAALGDTVQVSTGGLVQVRGKRDPVTYYVLERIR
ncbi:adenylate/guanylate cyclase domain-containing protein [Actinomycetes bacterium KLBMP 9759]